MNSFDLMIERYANELINAKRRSILQAIDDVDGEESTPQTAVTDETNDEPQTLPVPESKAETPTAEDALAEKPENGEPPDERAPEAGAENESKEEKPPIGNAPADSFGTLKIQVFAADRVYPVGAARVTVSDMNGNELFDGFTNVDGIIDGIRLPAPSPVFSEQPSKVRPYSQYNIAVEHSRFFPRKFIGVPVFADITSVQNVQLVPTEGGMLNQPDIDEREHNDGLLMNGRKAEEVWGKWQTE